MVHHHPSTYSTHPVVFLLPFHLCPRAVISLYFFNCVKQTVLSEKILCFYRGRQNPRFFTRFISFLAALTPVFFPFSSAHIPLFLYPFLNTISKTRPLEYLRLTSLGVIGALVKIDDPEVINFLLQTEIIPLCLRIMETGSELSKTVGGGITSNLGRHAARV